MQRFHADGGFCSSSTDTVCEPCAAGCEMNAAECKRQAVSQVHFPQEFDRYAALDAVITEWMAPYVARDSTVDPGTVLVDEVDPETFEHRTVERQIHAPRSVRPFNFGPAAVRDLANHIRRELKLK